MRNNSAMEADGDPTWQRFNHALCTHISRAKEGDVEAFEQLYMDTASWLLSRIRRLVGDGQAEDVLAEVYLQAWRSLSSFDLARGAATAWLSMIARSRALDHLRYEKCRIAVSDDFEITGEQEIRDGPEQLLSRAQDERMLHLSMSRLNCEERLVLGLAYFQDCTQTEIAQSTGLPLGTVKSLMSRAQRKLRTHLASTTIASTLAPVQSSPSHDPSQHAFTHGS